MSVFNGKNRIRISDITVFVDSCSAWASFSLNCLFLIVARAAQFSTTHFKYLMPFRVLYLTNNWSSNIYRNPVEEFTFSKDTIICHSRHTVYWINTRL